MMADDMHAVLPTREDREAASRFYGFDDEKDLNYWGNVSNHREVENLAAAFAAHRLRHSPAPAKGEGIEQALNGYRAAISYISADSWDGCSDCIEILKAARTADTGWDWAASPDRIAQELAKIRPYCHHALAALATPAGDSEGLWELLAAYQAFAGETAGKCLGLAMSTEHPAPDEVLMGIFEESQALASRVRRIQAGGAK